MALIGHAVSEEKMFEHCGRRLTPEHGHTVSSPCKPEDSGELRMGEQRAGRVLRCQTYICIVQLITRKSALRGTYTSGWCSFLSINIF